MVRSTCIDQWYPALNSAICKCLGVHGYACTTHIILGTLVPDSAAQSVHAICARLSCPLHALDPLDACTINPGASALLAKVVRPVLSVPTTICECGPTCVGTALPLGTGWCPIINDVVYQPLFQASVLG